MRRVLLTGASGFIGRHTIRLLLQAGYEVHAVRSSGQGPKDTHKDGVWWHQLDLLSAEPDTRALVRDVRPTHLMHLAWYAVPRLYWESAANFHWVRASLNLLQAFIDAGGRRAVFAGSCAEYDWSSGGVCSEHQTPLIPHSVYGICKNSLQHLVSSWSAQADLSTAWGRIFFVYGPGEPVGRLVPSITKACLEGAPIRTTHGKQLRDLLHVTDVADAFVAILESRATGPMNIGSGQGLRIADLITAIAKQFGREEDLELGALPASPYEPLELVANVSRLQKEVEWHPRILFDEGLSQTIAWWTMQQIEGHR